MQGMFKLILQELARDDPFFRRSMDCTQCQLITLEVKLLRALKHFACNGMAVDMFMDYFQMGKSTTLLAIKKVAGGICNNTYFHESI